MLKNKNGVDSGDGATPQKRMSECVDNTEIVGNCQAKIVSGEGAYHTANPDKKNPHSYGWLALDDIPSMVKNPVEVPKSEAPWAIFSGTGGPFAREHKFQRENGKYYALVGDLDDVGTLTALDISNALEIVFPRSTSHFIYSTKSATPENNKSRIIVPLAVPVSGAEYELYAKIFNDKLSAAGIEPDRATERCGQLFYLPNRGASYDYHII